MQLDFRLPGALASEINGRLQFALDLAIAAGSATLPFFRSSAVQVERKRDKSPVTAADKSAEQIARGMIGDRYRDDAILGEEFGIVEGQSEFEWIIDPIDGTKSFISGVPLYSTLIGMTYRGEPTIGVIYIPVLGELVIAAKGMGAWYGVAPLPGDLDYGINPGAIVLRRCQVSAQPKLEDGLLVTSQIDNFGVRQAESAYKNLEKIAYVTRTWGDGYGYLLVATGRAEAMVDPIVNPWDVAAVAPVIQEAGGTFSTWNGEYDIRVPHCLGSNGHVHERVLAELRPFA
jgi:histidinol-phosphatase